MAIADGLAINCSDLQAVGGTRLVAIRIWQEADAVVFGARFINKEDALGILDVFIKEKFEGGRHKRRVDKLN